MSGAPYRRFWSLDALRGLCALIVFLSHWVLWANFTPRGAGESTLDAFLHGCTRWFAWLAWPTGGNHPAVICFFVLSGFCIHHAYARDAQSAAATPDWRDFYRRRLVRIMPVYWTAALMGLVLVSAEAAYPTHNALLQLHTQGTPGEFALRLLAATDFYPDEILAGNGPLNTVAIEIVLYAIYPLIYRAAAKGWWLALGVIFVGFEVLGLWSLSIANPYWVYNSILMYGVFWYAGAATAHWFASRGTRSRVWELALTWAVFLVLNSLPHFYGLSVLKQTVFGLVCVFGVLQCLHLEQCRPAAANRIIRALAYVGDLSYSLYAVHTPVLLLATWALLRGRFESYTLQLVVTLTLAVAVTLVVHYAIERVFYRPRGSVGAAARAVSRPERRPVPA